MFSKRLAVCWSCLIHNFAFDTMDADGLGLEAQWFRGRMQDSRFGCRRYEPVRGEILFFTFLQLREY